MAKPAKKTVVPTPKKATGNSLADFRSVHDKNFVVPKKIREGLDKLGKDSWLNEIDFVKLCGISTQDLGRFREQFEEFYVMVADGRNQRRVWAGSKALAEKMRSMVS